MRKFVTTSLNGEIYFFKFFSIEDSIINLTKSECGEKELLARLNYLRQNSLTHVSFEDDR